MGPSPRSRAGPLATLLIASILACGAREVHEIPDWIARYSTIVEGVVTDVRPIERAQSLDCGAHFVHAPLRPYVRISMKVEHVWIGVVPGDTVSVLLSRLLGPRDPMVSLGQRALAFTNAHCDEYGDLSGGVARIEALPPRVVFEKQTLGGHGDLVTTLSPAEQTQRVVDRSTMEDRLRRLQRERAQDQLLAPAAVVVFVIRGLDRGPSQADVLCEPIATLAGASPASQAAKLHFRGPFDCGVYVVLGDTLVCPLATLDPPSVPDGHCPEEYVDRGGPITAFACPRSRIAQLYTLTDKGLVIRRR